MMARNIIRLPLRTHTPEQYAEELLSKVLVHPNHNYEALLSAFYHALRRRHHEFNRDLESEELDEQDSEV